MFPFIPQPGGPVGFQGPSQPSQLGPSWPTVKEDGSADDGQCILSPATPWKSPGLFTSLLVI